jgi:hypothetical protein
LRLNFSLVIIPLKNLNHWIRAGYAKEKRCRSQLLKKFKIAKSGTLIALIAGVSS